MDKTVDLEITGGLKFSATEFAVEARTDAGRQFLGEVTGVTVGGKGPTGATFEKSFLGTFLERAAVHHFFSLRCQDATAHTSRPRGRALVEEWTRYAQELHAAGVSSEEIERMRLAPFPQH